VEQEAQENKDKLELEEKARVAKLEDKTERLEQEATDRARRVKRELAGDK